MVRRVLFLCSLSLAGCGFLDDDLLLDDEAYATSVSGGYGGSSYSCGTRSYKRASLRLGELTVSGEGYEDYTSEEFDEDYEYDFEDEDIRGKASQTTVTHYVIAPKKDVDPWLSEFVRLEDEQLDLVRPSLDTASPTNTPK